MNNLAGYIAAAEADDNFILFMGHINHLIGHAAENLVMPIEQLGIQRRKPARNRDYVEQTIPLYTLDEFKSHFRMSRASLEILITEISNIVPPKREPQISLEKKVLFTIWILAKPESFLACSDRFGIAQSSGHYIYTEIVNAICLMLPNYIAWPNQQQCQENATVFQERSRGIPNVIGAIDGTHIFIKQPFGNAVDYYNRYQSHSVILQAVCDVNKKFVNISVGHPGRMHDARVFRSFLYQRLMDENHPLIRRSIIERAFGLLKGKWRRFKFLDMYDMELLNKVITSCCILDNFIICHQGGEADEIDDFVEEEQDVAPIAINERRKHIMGERKREEIMNLL